MIFSMTYVSQIAMIKNLRDVMIDYHKHYNVIQASIFFFLPM